MLSGLFGFTRQAFYKSVREKQQDLIQGQLVLEMVRKQRQILKKAGSRKLLLMLRNKFFENNIQMGRDAFFDLLRENGLLIRRRKRKAVTTMSNHWLFKYPNLIKEIIITRPDQVWVADITYIETDEGYLYLYLLTDAYSRKILGFSFADNLRAINAVQALQMAIANSTGLKDGLIHHSDRGVQYCSEEYVKVLQKNKIAISMAAVGNPYENAIAERVNGILKDEWINDLHFETHRQAGHKIAETIIQYNNLRLHSSCNMLTPSQAYKVSGELKKHWKTYRRERKPELISNLEAGFSEVYSQQHIEKQTQPVETG
jgi:transposase InsO family protein